MDAIAASLINMTMVRCTPSYNKHSEPVISYISYAMMSIKLHDIQWGYIAIACISNARASYTYHSTLIRSKSLRS